MLFHLQLFETEFANGDVTWLDEFKRLSDDILPADKARVTMLIETRVKLFEGLYDPHVNVFEREETEAEQRLGGSTTNLRIPGRLRK